MFNIVVKPAPVERNGDEGTCTANRQEHSSDSLQDLNGRRKQACEDCTEVASICRVVGLGIQKGT